MSRTGRTGRWVRRAAWILGALLALPLAVAALALAALRTPWGGGLALDRALPAVNGAIAGRVEVGDLRLYGDTLLLRDVTLAAPDGERVARVPLVLIDLDVPGLLGGAVSLDRLALVGPRLSLRTGPRGLNLARAVAPAQARPPSPPPIFVDRVSVESGRIGYARAGAESGAGPNAGSVGDASGRGATDRSATGGRAPAVRVTQLSVVASLQLPRGPGTRALVGATGRLAAPETGPLGLTGRLRDEAGARVAQVRLEAAGSLLAAHGRVGGAEDFTVVVKEGRLSEPLVEALLPRPAPAGGVRLSGRVARDGPEVSGDLSVRAGEAALSVEGAVNLAQRSTPGLEVTGRHLDPSRLRPSLPAGDVSFHLTANGSAPSLGGARGEARLSMAPSRLAGRALGPVTVRAEADAEGLHLAVPEGRLPGLRLGGRIRSDPSGALGGRLTARVADAAAAADFVGALAGRGLPTVEGRGRVEVTPLGTLNAPGVALSARAPRLAVGDRSVSGLAVDARAPAVQRPRVGEATVSADRVSLGGRTLRGLEVRLDAGADRVAGRASLTDPPVSLRLAGDRDRARRRVRLDRLEVAYPEASWSLDGTAQVSTAPASPGVEDLVLVSGDQRLTLTASAGDTPRVALTAAGLRLAALPGALLPKGVSPRGRVDAEAHARVTPQGPVGEARVQLSRGRIAGLSGVSATATAQLGRDRAEGKVSAELLSGRLWVDWGVPWPPPVEDDLYLAVRVRDVSLGQALEAARARASQPVAPSVTGVSGRLEADAKLWGDPAAPRGRGRVEVQDGRVALEGAPLPYDVHVLVEGTPSRIDLQNLALEAGDGSARLAGRAVRSRGRRAWVFDVRLSGRADHLQVPGETPQVMSTALALEGQVSPQRADLELDLADLAFVPPAGGPSDGAAATAQRPSGS